MPTAYRSSFHSACEASATTWAMPSPSTVSTNRPSRSPRCGESVHAAHGLGPRVCPRPSARAYSSSTGPWSLLPETVNITTRSMARPSAHSRYRSGASHHIDTIHGAGPSPSWVIGRSATRLHLAGLITELRPGAAARADDLLVTGLISLALDGRSLHTGGRPVAPAAGAPGRTGSRRPVGVSRRRGSGRGVRRW